MFSVFTVYAPVHGLPVSLGVNVEKEIIMKSDRSLILLALGSFEIFFSLRTLWGVANGSRHAIILANIIVRGLPAQIIFILIAIAGLCLGYGIIRQKLWAFWGFVALNCLLILLYISNLLLVDQFDLLRFYTSVAGNYLLSYRLDILRRMFIVIAQIVILIVFRKRFVNNKTLTKRFTGSA